MKIDLDKLRLFIYDFYQYKSIRSFANIIWVNYSSFTRTMNWNRVMSQKMMYKILDKLNEDVIIDGIYIRRMTPRLEITHFIKKY